MASESPNSRPPHTLSGILSELSDVRDCVASFWDESIDLFETVTLNPSALDEPSEEKAGGESQPGEDRLRRNIVQVVRDMCERHRYLHPIISHFGRNITRCFPRADEPHFLANVLDTEEKVSQMLELIADYLIRNGYLDVALKIVEKLPENSKTGLLSVAGEFEQWGKIFALIKNNDIKPVLEWLQDLRQNPGERGAIKPPEGLRTIDYHLNEALVLSYLAKGDYQAALTHAREHLAEIARSLKMEQQLEIVMTCFLGTSIILGDDGVSRKAQQNRYAYYFSEDYRQTVSHELAKWLCQACGMETANPLEQCLTFGRAVIPALLRTLQSLVQVTGTMGLDFSADSELPICLQPESTPNELDDSATELHRQRNQPGSYCFHSRFICPILKVHSTADNPPMRLRCGHVISNEAVSRLNVNNRLRCPYCTSEQSPSDVQRIWI